MRISALLLACCLSLGGWAAGGRPEDDTLREYRPPSPCTQAETVEISVPALVTFTVALSGGAATGQPNPASIRFSQAKLRAGRHLRISVKAETPGFAAPDGRSTLPAGSVSWTVGRAVSGAGRSGTLSFTDFTPVFDAIPLSQCAPSGLVNLTWRLIPPVTGLNAGSYTLLLRWKIESVGC